MSATKGRRGSRPEDALLVSWSRRAGPSAAMDERTAIDADGTVWLWVQVSAAADRADTAGTFRTTASADELDSARRLAAALAGWTSSPDGAPPPGAIEVSAGDQHRTLAPGRESGARADAVALGETLTEKALGKPLATVRLRASTRPSVDFSSLPGIDAAILPPELAVPDGGGVIIRLELESRGLEPVAVTIDPAHLQIHWLAGERTLQWAELPRLERGLAGGEDYYDGLRAPARIAPGQTAAAIAATLRPPGEADGFRLRAAGKIRLIGPGRSIDVPADSFEVRSPAVRL
ncbi:MAG TPA: hypothetical protein VEX41_06575 [Candidatus Eisenbacteria bacterium]|nr:hypothetical protein [Candidatus Eisenbacteria bacterium]